MLHDVVTKGSVDRSVTVKIIDSADGTPETGVVFNTSGIDLWYRREGAARTAITEATLAALTTAHTDGGFLHVSDGVYRLDLPDAAFATGANYVDFGGTVTGMVVIGGRVRLVDFSLEDSVRMGMTALPNAAAQAAGGLYTRGAGAGQINQQTNGQIDVNLERWINVAPLALSAQRVQVLVGAISNGVIVAATFAANALDAVWSTATRLLTAGTNIVLAKGTGVTGFNDLDATGVRGAVGLATANLDTQLSAIEGQTDDIGAAGAGLTAVPWNAAWDAEVQSEVADALAVYNPPTKAELDAAVAPLATATALATVDTVVDAINARLPSDPADESLVIDATTAIFNRLGAPAGASMSADIADVEGKVDDLEGRLTAQRATNLDNLDVAVSTRATPAQVNTEADSALADVGLTTTVTGRIDVDVSSRLAAAGYTVPPSATAVATQVRTELTPELARIDVAVSSRATPGQVNAEVLDVLTVDTFTEPIAVPAATATILDRLRWLFVVGRNKITQSSTTQTVRNAADSASIGQATVSDDGSVFTRSDYS